MKKIMIGLVAMTSLVFGTGCGGDICDDTEDAFQTLVDKTEDCAALQAALESVQPSESEIEECKDSLDDCSDGDKDKISEFVDCVNDMDECKSGQEEAWGADFQACANELQGVSEACGGT